MKAARWQFEFKLNHVIFEVSALAHFHKFFSAAAFYPFGEILFKLNGRMSHRLQARHFHISLVCLSVRSVCLETLTGHYSQCVLGSTDSHCVKTMNPSFYWITYFPTGHALGSSHSNLNEQCHFDAADDAPMKKTLSEYLNLLSPTFFSLFRMTSAFQVCPKLKPGSGFTDATVSRCNSLLVVVFLWDFYEKTKI